MPMSQWAEQCWYIDTQHTHTPYLVIKPTDVGLSADALALEYSEGHTVHRVAINPASLCLLLQKTAAATLSPVRTQVAALGTGWISSSSCWM